MCKLKLKFIPLNQTMPFEKIKKFIIERLQEVNEDNLLDKLIEHAKQSKTVQELYEIFHFTD